jgi:hypothetical protein
MFDSVGCCETTRCCSDQPASPANEAVEFLPTGRFLREASRRCLVCARRVARLILSFVVAPLLRSTGWSLQRAIAPFVADYLVYMNKLEAEGHLWASGPFIEEGVLAGDGLTILSTPTIEEAERVIVNIHFETGPTSKAIIARQGFLVRKDRLFRAFTKIYNA